MSHQSVIPAEQGVTAQASVVAGLGYPNGRAETSPTPTGWQASAVLADGSADQSSASVTVIATSITARK
ncbi:MAG: hypothetical protein KGL72_06920 [Actinomycetales bacterium]|nr:hypothetical protein [Actinomycetales bacterium]